jgi:hypothetical protein
MHQCDRVGDDARISGGQHSVPEVEHVARGSRGDGATAVLHDIPYGPLDYGPTRQQHHRIEVAL